MKRTQMPRPRKRLKPVGKQGRLNQRANRVLKRTAEALDIDRCELGYDGCTGTEFLSWAHSKKRRKLTDEELQTEAICACLQCHSFIERLPPDEMRAVVLGTLARRADRYVERIF